MIKKEIQKNELRKFGLIIGFGFPLILGWLVPLLFSHEFRSWTLWVSPPLIIFGIFFPGLLYYPYKFWFFIGRILGFINSIIILGFVYIFVLLPVAFIMKINGYNPLNKNKKNVNTFRELKANIRTDFTRIF